MPSVSGVSRELEAATVERIDTRLLDALRAPATYGVPGPVLVAETHASWVFLVGESAYKVKKPVRLAFLDYGTLERRRAACHEEIRVNRELAGGIYRDVLAILPDRDGVRLAPEDTPGAVEYAIRMRRFDESSTLKSRLAAGTLPREQLALVAQRVAAFHASARVCSAGGSRETLARWEENLDELTPLLDDEATVHAMRRFARAFVSAHATEIERRARAGRVRDGHGDLRCEHVLLGDPVAIVDRIEFDPSLREVDVGCDLAFLLMDLHANGAEGAARSLLSEYRRAGGEPGSAQLVSFFCAYWALVRAKVAVLAQGGRAGGSEQPPEMLVELARRFCWSARQPMAILVTGPAASGKSTLAAELSRPSGWPVLSSDETRKRLAGLAATQRAAPAHYTDEFSRLTYRELGARGAELLARGGGVLIDASCSKRFERAELLSGLDAVGAPRLFLACRVSLHTAQARAAERARRPRRVSDATPAIVARQFREYEPIDEQGEGEVAVLDGGLALAGQVEQAAEALDRALARRAPPAAAT